MTKSVNKNIATEPPKTLAAQKKMMGGLSVIDQKLSLMPLKVLFDADGDLKVSKGATVWIDANNCSKQIWARTVYTHGDVEFILVPENAVLLVE